MNLTPRDRNDDDDDAEQAREKAVWAEIGSSPSLRDLLTDPIGDVGSSFFDLDQQQSQVNQHNRRDVHYQHHQNAPAPVATSRYETAQTHKRSSDATAMDHDEGDNMLVEDDDFLSTTTRTRTTGADFVSSHNMNQEKQRGKEPPAQGFLVVPKGDFSLQKATDSGNLPDSVMSRQTMKTAGGAAPTRREISSLLSLQKPPARVRKTKRTTTLQSYSSSSSVAGPPSSFLPRKKNSTPPSPTQSQSQAELRRSSSSSPMLLTPTVTDSRTTFGTSPVSASKISPTERDILCGREKERQFHVGNRTFIRLVSSKLDDYERAKSKGEKTNIVKEIHRIVTEQEGGRFLKFNESTGEWHEMSNTRARDKIGRAVRDCLTRQRRNRRKAKERKEQQERRRSMEQQQHQLQHNRMLAAGSSSEITTRTTRSSSAAIQEEGPSVFQGNHNQAIIPRGTVLPQQQPRTAFSSSPTLALAPQHQQQHHQEHLEQKGKPLTLVANSNSTTRTVGDSRPGVAPTFYRPHHQQRHLTALQQSFLAASASPAGPLPVEQQNQYQQKKEEPHPMSIVHTNNQHNNEGDGDKNMILEASFDRSAPVLGGGAGMATTGTRPVAAARGISTITTAGEPDISDMVIAVFGANSRPRRRRQQHQYHEDDFEDEYAESSDSYEESSSSSATLEELNRF